MKWLLLAVTIFKLIHQCQSSVTPNNCKSLTEMQGKKDNPHQRVNISFVTPRCNLLITIITIHIYPCKQGRLLAMHDP